MPNEPVVATPLWSQFLNRLSSHDEPPISSSVVLEIVLTLDHDFPLGINQLRRIGGLIAESLPDSVVLVGAVSGDAKVAPTLYYGSQSTPRNRQLWKDIYQEKILTHKPSQGQLTQNIPINNLGLMRRWYRVELPKAWLIILSPDSVNRTERQLLRLVNRLVERRRQYHELARNYEHQTEQFNTLTHHLSEGLAIVGADLTVQIWNRPLQRLIGYSPLEVKQQSIKKFLVQPKNPQWLEQLVKEQHSRSASQVFQQEVELQTKLGRLVWVNISGSFLRDKSHSISQIIILISDISRHKELESRKNEFISIATHELRTPITAIKGYLSLLQNAAGKDLSPKPLAYLERAQQANDRLTRLSEELLQVVQVEENRVRFNLRPLSLQPLLTKVVADLHEKAEHKNLQLQIENPDFDTVIAADASRLEQVFSNLVDNGIKYTKEGGITIRFERTVSPVNQEAQIATHIIDTGIGLSSKELPTIFEKFHRTAEARASNESGAGLGLFIVKTFIEKQGGTISVKSSFRHGSQFTVTFPAVDDQTKIERTNAHQNQESIVD